MRTRAIAVAALAVALMGTVLAPDDDGTQPPLNIVAAPEMTLSRLLAAHAKAIGASKIKTLKEHWTIHDSGLDGTQDVVDRNNDEHSDETLGTTHTAAGTVGGRSWHQNSNGEVVVESNIHQRSAVDNGALRAGGPGVALLGKVAESNAYVVRVNPPGGRLEYAYFDTTSFLLKEVDRAEAGTRIVTTYDDYRTADGLTLAWHLHRIIARTGAETDRKMQSAMVGVAVTDSDVAMPASTTPVHAPNAFATLPAKILSDRVILRTEINGRAVNLQLDSGAAGIVIDKDVLEALHIKLQGNSVATMAGNYTISRAVVPHIAIGPVSLDNVTVDAIPFAQLADEKTPVAGLIGFDFIDGAVLHINYEKGTVEAIDPASFTPPSGATSIKIGMDDDVPIVGAKIGATLATNFILDTGADRSTLNSTFVSAHPKDAADQGLGTQMRDAFPFETVFYGVGGKVAFHETQVGPFSFGGQTFPTWLFNATYGASSFELEDYDGLIGQDVLRYFDVYLDYAHQRILVAPNERYRNRFG